jgi:adenylate cyclase
MAEQRILRRLAAILAADIVGYSRLMEADEAGTLARLKALRAEFLHPTVTRFGGRIVKTTGDGTLIEFPSAVDAVQNAVEVQLGMASRNATYPPSERIDIRIGINVGDIVIDDNDIYGDGVNIAARLESLAPPGGICVSANVREQIRNNLDVSFEDLGDQHVKNIARPIRAYRVVDAQQQRASESPRLPAATGKPSIAVLPFINLSGDPEQEYFADGMVDEIITSLARIEWLVVTARTSTFAFKGHNADIRDIARKLNVRYVLEGSVRKASNRVRIIGQLIDADTGAHIWADRVEGKMDDIFDLQDRITENVVGAIEPKLRIAEIERAKRKRPDSLDAYDYYLKALQSEHRPVRETFNEAIQLIERSLAVDPNYSPASALGAWLYFYRLAGGWSTTPEADRARALELARTAVDQSDGYPYVLCQGGFILAALGKDIEMGTAAVKRAVDMSPHSAVVLHQAGWALTFVGAQDQAVEYLKASTRLSPSSPINYRALTGVAAASVLAGHYDEAVTFGEEARRQFAGWGPTHRFLAAAYANLGDLGKAAEALAQMLKLEPRITISHLKSFLPYQNAEQAERLWSGLRKAGMPE